MQRPPDARAIDDSPAGALLVDTRPWEQRSRDGSVPGAVVDRSVPASSGRLEQ